MWKGPRFPLDGLGMDPSSVCISGHRTGGRGPTRPSRSRARNADTAHMRRGLLFVMLLGAASLLAACVPPSSPPAPTTTTSPTGSGATWAQNGSLGSCRVFPADNPWNRDVSTLPVDGNSANYLTAIVG